MFAAVSLLFGCLSDQVQPWESAAPTGPEPDAATDIADEWTDASDGDTGDLSQPSDTADLSPLPDAAADVFDVFDIETQFEDGPVDIAEVPYDTAVDRSDSSTATGPLLVAVVSDLNSSYGSTTYTGNVHAAIAEVIAVGPDLVLSTGDMVAGQKAGLDYEAMWDGFHAAVSDPLQEAGIPFAVTPGNHDASGYSAYQTERSIFVEQWTVRQPDVTFVDDAHYPLRYSFAVGDVFFLSLDATTVGPLGDDQMIWLEDQLDAADEAGYSVRVVIGHVPLYPFTVGQETAIIGDSELEELLNEYNVTLFLSGHHHGYYPGRRGDLRLASMACLGTGTRPFLGETKHAPRAIVFFEIDEGEVQWLEGYQGADFQTLIERSDLPESLGSGDNIIYRDDL